MLSRFKNTKQLVFNNIKNIPGKTTDRKIVVIECDDWGGIRMPSSEAYRKMKDEGLPIDEGRYTKYDTLEDKDDLEELFNVLVSVKDRNGKYAVMTPVCSVANPDFDKIKESDFSNYYYEPFTRTLERYNRHPKTFELWKKGIETGIFMPELHGREHISVQIWMNELKKGNKELLRAFNYGFAALRLPNMPSFIFQFRPEFYFDNINQLNYLKDSIISGISLFEEIFGFKPISFVPSNALFHPELEETIIQAGVKYLYMDNSMKMADGRGGIKRYRKRRNSYLKYYKRNCVFEPTDNNYKGIEYTLAQIKAAFRWRKPANISTHRVNFIGGLDKRNREKGLSELKNLLNRIMKRWPDVEFMPSREMFTILY